jgi:hypothetical protein
MMALSVSASAQQSPKLSDEDYAQRVLAAAPEAVAKKQR